MRELKGSTYLTRLRALVGGLAAILALANVSWAKDYCINFTAFPGCEIVGRAFTIPPKGKCKTWIGFFSCGPENAPSTGTGCTSSDGSSFAITIGSSFPESTGGSDVDAVALSLPAQTGTSHETGIDGTGHAFKSVFAVTGGSCANIAVPTVGGSSGSARLGLPGGR